MIPATFVFLDALPLTPNGKIDRRALPPPEDAVRAGAPGASPVAPRDVVEEAVASIWAEVLEVPRVSVHEDFFALGGHSLLAIQVITRLRDLLRAELPLRAMLERPTVAAFADAILGDPAQQAIVAAAELVVQVSELSEEEAETMIKARESEAPRDR